MKKLFILVLALVLAMGALGLVACGGSDTVSYTVNSEQWDNAVSLYWKNLTYEYTDGESGNKVELLEDGGLHQYAGEGHGWGEEYVIYADNKWKVYQGDATTPISEYETEAEYIARSYGDDFGFMGHMLPTISGRNGRIYL